MGVRDLDGKWTIRQKAVLALCALSIILDGFDTQVLGFAAPTLLSDWKIDKGQLAPILGIGLFGMTIGAAMGGYVGDRLGRRLGMIASTILFGLATCAMAAATNLWTLAAFRFVAGIGLGGALPIAATLVAEFAPANRKSLAVSISIICIPVGGILGGMFAAPLLPLIGWRGLFLIAGALPLVVAVIHWFALPESPSFQKPPVQGAERQGQQLDPPERANFFQSLAAMNIVGDTIALWAAFFASLMSGYLYFNWLPVLLAESGFALSATSLGLLIYNVGCVASGVIVGAIATRAGAQRPLVILAASASFGAILLTQFALTPDRTELLMIALGVQGFTLGGVQVMLYALAVQFFPAHIRTTGIGSAASIGRLGAIISSALGAVVLASGSFGFFLAIAIAQLACMMCVLKIRRPAPC